MDIPADMLEKLRTLAQREQEALAGIGSNYILTSELRQRLEAAEGDLAQYVRAASATRHQYERLLRELMNSMSPPEGDWTVDLKSGKLVQEEKP